MCNNRILATCVMTVLMIAAVMFPGVVGAGEPQTKETESDTEGFVSLFNGKDLTGWTGATKGYVVEDGKIVWRGGRNLFTQKEYSDFILRFEFKLTAGANNGLAIRAPLKGNPSRAGMELQILDNTARKYKNLKPYQYHGSIYGLVPAKRGHLKPVGEWNLQEVTAGGSHITVKLNGVTIVDADVKKYKRPKKGHIGFLGHGSRVEFRNIRIKELEDMLEHVPEGFVALFNGKDLSGWKGLVGNPVSRAKMSPEDLAKAQAKADEKMHAHWNVVDKVLVFGGKGSHLCTMRDYGDFELLVDWKIESGGDSGIYLRGSPQVQIWDSTKSPEGSGGLYNNKKNPRKPLKCADKPVGEWNTFRIKMIGERVTVYLNDVLVVDDVIMENYWDRSRPIFPTGQIELQSHGSKLCFRNALIRELRRKEE